MTYRITLLLCLIISISIQAQSISENDLPELTFSSERLSRVDSFLQSWVEEGKIPYAVSMIVQRGETVHHQAYGWKDADQQEAMTTDAIFRIASQTKLVTSVAVMMLYEQGEFLLEDPISRYIAAFADPQVLETYDSATLEYETRPASREITIRDLLTHTAGISYDHPLNAHPEFDIPFLASTENMVLGDAINRLAKRPLIHEPGAQFTYGPNTDILGRLVEVVSGKTLAEFFEESIFTPLGMNDTYFYLPLEKKERLVTLYSKESTEGPLTISDNETYQNFPKRGAQTYYLGGAGLVSTAADYNNICQLILNGGAYNGVRLLSPLTIRLMASNHIGELEVWDRKDKFGYGLMLFTSNSRYGDLAPVGSANWGGAYCSEYTIDFEHELVLQVYTNVMPFAHYGEFVRKYRVLVYQALVVGE
ncbi:serine hydrolase domain-containing protein [Catalinimonas sp. 4WD22]|uniref:serine hydrolase domain-containing protein n=1 Tax=Catalinimonas locisalis TaxID=3133978 RepID=UPI003100C110